MVNTQPNRWRGVPPEYLVDVQDRPYIINSVQNELFEVVFFSKEGFYENMDLIIENAKATISDCLFKEKFRLTILWELLENIQKHSSCLSSQKLSLKKEENQYTVELSNLCEENDFQKLISFLEVNAMSSKELKEAYKKQQLEGKISERNWAWLGFLTIARAIKKHSQIEDFELIDIKNIGNKAMQVTDDKWTEIVNFIDTKLTINIPFPKKAGIINNLTDDCID